jgi:hypothetical protein
MIVIVGLIILIAAVIVGVAGVLTNGGSTHALTHGFAVFGYHVTGSTGTLFLYGIVVGALALFGLSVLLAGARRTSRRGSATRRELKQSRRETAAASQARDDLIDERDNARAATASDSAASDSAASDSAASAPANGTPRSGRLLISADSPLSRLRQFGRASAPPPGAGTDPESPTGKAAADVSADAAAVDVPAGASAPADDPRKVSPL